MTTGRKVHQLHSHFYIMASILIRILSIFKRRVNFLFLVLLLSITYLIIYLEQERKTTSIIQALGTRKAEDFVKRYEDTTMLDATKGCQFDGGNLDAVILVTTLASSRLRREAIRQTWASWKYEYNVMVFFFAGTPDQSEMEDIKLENKLHGDLIIENLEESYHSLTVKTLRMLKWFLSHCSKSKFLIKTDDDVFIHIPNMLKYLSTTVLSSHASINSIEAEQSPMYQNYIGGLVHVGRSPHTFNPFSKWYVPSQLWPNDKNRTKDNNARASSGDSDVFPPYVGGPCYVLSSLVSAKLYKVSLEVPIFPLEDVYLTGLIAGEKLKIQLQSIPNMYDAHYPRLNKYLSGSDYLKAITSYHTDGDTGLMFDLYKEMTTD